MILDMILAPLTSALVFSINLLPDIDFALVGITNFMEWFINLINLISYVMPVKSLLTLFILYIAIKNFEFAWAVIKRIYDLIPFV